jgi:hypothetical protein
MNDVLLITKRCRDCGEVKPASQFYAAKTNRDGLNSYCKPCDIDHRRRRVEQLKAAMGEEAYNAQQAERQRNRRKDPEVRKRDRRANRRVQVALAELRERHRPEYEAILARLAYEDGAS